MTVVLIAVLSAILTFRGPGTGEGRPAGRKVTFVGNAVVSTYVWNPRRVEHRSASFFVAYCGTALRISNFVDFLDIKESITYVESMAF